MYGYYGNFQGPIHWRNQNLDILPTFMTTWHKQESFERWEHLGKCLCKISLQKRLWGSFLISDWHGKAQPILSGATPGLVVLASLRNQAEQAINSKPKSSNAPTALASAPASSFLSCLSACPDFLRWWTMMWKCNHFPPSGLCSWCFISAVATLTETEMHTRSQVQLWQTWLYCVGECWGHEKFG